VLVILLLIAGLACLMVAPVALAGVATVCLGLGIGALFPLSLIVAMDHADSPVSCVTSSAHCTGLGR